MNIQFDEKTPIYMQIMNMIKRDIANKKILIGEKLPSVREISSKVRVNPNTIQRAYQELEREGITYTLRGTGTFVREDLDMISELKKEMAKDVIVAFISGMKDLGFDNTEIINIVSTELNKEDH
jgi:GntR family transcriptional regulator